MGKSEWTLNDAKVRHGYELGLSDAWEAARKIEMEPNNGGLSFDEMSNIFKKTSAGAVFEDYTPQEAIAKIKAYEDSKEIKRGDEVDHQGLKSIVIRTCPDAVYTVTSIGTTPKYTGGDIQRLVKTGRNFADKLDALLSEIGGHDNVEKV